MPTTLASMFAPGENRSSRAAGGGEQSMTNLQRELELLGYVTSHNLQSPLRAILGYCDEIKNLPGKQSKTISSETAQQLSYEADRLREMMKLMVDYIQLETHPVRHSHVDLNEVMSTVQVMLATEIEESGAVITCDTLPVVWGHQGRLTRLMAYLVENAIRFRSKEPCMVKITSRNTGDSWEISVQDNGIGIEEDNQAIVFRLFKRLHTAEEYPGYGAGLALAHKIVESHNGAIGVESAKGQGSRFFFTLPMTPKEHR